MATQHRPKRARIKNQLRGTARAVEDLMPANGETTLTALVVDDEPLVRRFLSTVLRRDGWSVHEAADAVAALAVADAERLDLLVTDFDLPSVSGVSLAIQLRAMDQDLPVLVVSGHPDAARSTRALLGRTAFAAKPVGADELLSTVGSIVH